MDGLTMMQALRDGVFSEETIGGAILYHASGGKSFLNLFSGGKATAFHRSEKLKNGNTRNTNGARSAAQLKAMANLPGVPDNLSELIAGGLDLGIPVEE